jgi:glycogen debranching enzyme
MAFKVQVGPAQIAIRQGQTVLVIEPDGQVSWPSTRGLYFRDTRVISAWAIYANGERWDLLNGGAIAIAYHAARIFETNRAFVSEDGPIAARTLGLVIGRHINGGLHEDIDITNNSQNPVRFNLEIVIRADFADIFEVHSGQIVRRGRITTSWSHQRQALRISYRNKDFGREVIVRIGEGDGQPTVYANGRLSFDIALDAGEAWHRCLNYNLVDGAQRIRAPRECVHFEATPDHARKMDAWQRAVLKIETSNEEFYRCYSQGVQYMAALRLPSFSLPSVTGEGAARLEQRSLGDDIGDAEINDEPGNVDERRHKRGRGAGRIKAEAFEGKRQHRAGQRAECHNSDECGTDRGRDERPV